LSTAPSSKGSAPLNEVGGIKIHMFDARKIMMRFQVTRPAYQRFSF
jgi:hypothetical protein